MGPRTAGGTWGRLLAPAYLMRPLCDSGRARPDGGMGGSYTKEKQERHRPPECREHGAARASRRRAQLDCGAFCACATSAGCAVAWATSTWPNCTTWLRGTGSQPGLTCALRVADDD